jgi:ATP-dependent Clp protease adaptor protein ClpS
MVKELEKVIDSNGIGEKVSIVIYNDDVNSFDHVETCLMAILKHSFEQAQQCALIIHTKGKCSVKNGTFEELRTPCETLIDQGLNATIE